MKKLMQIFFYFLLVVSCSFYVTVIKGEDKVLNILSFENSEKYGEKILHESSKPASNELDLLKKHINDNNMEEALKIIESMRKESANAAVEKENMEKISEESSREQTNDEEKEHTEHMSEPFNMQSFNEMMQFYSYIQQVLNSKAETSEKKLVRQFLRKSIQNLKKNEKEHAKKTVEDIIKNTEGHNEMLEKLADIMKIDKEKLKDEETRSNLDKVLIGILKFIDYTNKTNVVESLIDEIEIEEVENVEKNDSDGEGSKSTGGLGTKKKLQLNLSNSKTHWDMIQKASSFMGIEIEEDKLKELTSKNPWYQQYVNKILDYASNYEDEL